MFLKKSDFKVSFHDDSISFTSEYARNQKIVFAETYHFALSYNGKVGLNHEKCDDW